MDIFLGFDVGSVSTNIVAIDSNGNVLESCYLRTEGRPILSVQAGMSEVEKALNGNNSVIGVGTTGSARHLVGVMVGADVVKNEITAHAIASSRYIPGVRTVIEIGGQDSKIIILENGIVRDFAMNTVCAAGTGSFLDQQASRLGISIEKFGEYALKSSNPVRIAGRCTVFAESDMIHKQQMGHNIEDIIAGLCEALVRNYLNNVARGKEILPLIIFQGGVAANIGIKRAFEKALSCEIVVPEYHNVMGAIGAALLAMEQAKSKKGSKFKGFIVSQIEIKTMGFECSDCPNCCEVVEVWMNQKMISRWGDRCGKWGVMD